MQLARKVWLNSMSLKVLRINTFNDFIGSILRANWASNPRKCDYTCGDWNNIKRVLRIEFLDNV